MGFTWSLHVCQTAMEHQVTLCESWRDMLIMRDGGGNILLQARQVKSIRVRMKVVTDLSDGSRYYVYVDHLGLFTSSSEDAKRRIRQLVEHMSSVNLIMHETAVSGETLESLGVVLDFAQPLTTISRKRGTRIRGAIRALLKRGKASGDTIRRVVGHCTFAALLR